MIFARVSGVELRWSEETLALDNTLDDKDELDTTEELVTAEDWLLDIEELIALLAKELEELVITTRIELIDEPWFCNELDIADELLVIANELLAIINELLLDLEINELRLELFFDDLLDESALIELIWAAELEDSPVLPPHPASEPSNKNNVINLNWK